MTVQELASGIEAEIITGTETDLSRPTEGCYCGDLLSWVMGRAVPGGAWVTIMSNANVAAVAHMADVSCVILAENVAPDAELVARAEKEGIVVMRSNDAAYDIARKIHECSI